MHGYLINQLETGHFNRQKGKTLEFRGGYAMKEQCHGWRMRRRIKKRKGRQTGTVQENRKSVWARTQQRRRKSVCGQGINLGQTEQWYWESLTLFGEYVRETVTGWWTTSGKLCQIPRESPRHSCVYRCTLPKLLRNWLNNMLCFRPAAPRDTPAAGFHF